MESCFQIGRRPVEREHVAAGKPYFRLTNYTQHDHSQLLKSRVPRCYGSKVSWKVGISRLLVIYLGIQLIKIMHTEFCVLLSVYELCQYLACGKSLNNLK